MRKFPVLSSVVRGIPLKKSLQFRTESPFPRIETAVFEEIPCSAGNHRKPLSRTMLGLLGRMRLGNCREIGGDWRSRRPRFRQARQLNRCSTQRASPGCVGNVGEICRGWEIGRSSRTGWLPTRCSNSTCRNLINSEIAVRILLALKIRPPKVSATAGNSIAEIAAANPETASHKAPDLLAELPDLGLWESSCSRKCRISREISGTIKIAE